VSENKKKRLSIKEAAKLLGMGESTLAKKIHSLTVEGIFREDKRIWISLSSIPELKKSLNYNDEFDAGIYYPTHEVAKKMMNNGLIVNRTDINNWIRTGKVASILHMGYRYIHENDIQELIKVISTEREMPDGFCTIEEASKILGRHQQTIREWISQGEIEAKRVIINHYWKTVVKKDSLQAVKRKKRLNMLKNFAHLDINKIVNEKYEDSKPPDKKQDNLDSLPSGNFYKVKEAANLLGIKINTLQSILREGKFPLAIKVKNVWYIPKEGVQSYLATRSKKLPTVTPKKTPSMDGYFTISSVSLRINLSHSRISLLIKEGVFPNAKKVSNKWFIPEKDILFYQEDKRAKAEKQSSIIKERKALLPGFLKISDVVKTIHISRSKIYNLIQTGLFPNATKVNGKWFIPKEELHFCYEFISKVNQQKNITKTSKGFIQPQDYSTTKETAGKLGISVAGVIAVINRGNFKGAEKINNKWFIPDTDLVAYKEQRDKNPISITKPEMIDELNQFLSSFQDEIHLKDTIKVFSDFSMTRLNATSGRINNVRRVFNNLKRLFSEVILNLKYEIYELPDEEIESVMKNHSYSNPVRELFLKLLKESFSIKGKYLKKEYVLSRKGKLTDTEIDAEIYSPEVYYLFEQHVKDIEQHINSAINSRQYANMWVLTAMLLTNAWRPSDIIFEMPNIDIEVINVKEFEWFKKNRLSKEQSQLILNQLYLKLNNAEVSKTKANLHFLVAPDMVQCLAYACVISELHRRSLSVNDTQFLKDYLLLGTFISGTTENPNTSGISSHHKFFKNKSELTPFSSKKLNNSTMTYLFLDISEDVNVSELALEVPKWARSHEDANVTAGYIKLTNKDGTLDRVSINLFKRGHFGWLYNYMVQLAFSHSGIHQTLEERTKTIGKLKREYSPFQIEEWAKSLLDYKNRSESVVKRLYKMNKETLKEVVINIYTGQMPSRDGCGQCLSFPNCHFYNRKTCIGCTNFIPKLQQVMIEAREEFYRLVESIKACTTGTILKRDTMFLFNILLLFNEAAEAFGNNTVNGFISAEERKILLFSIAEKLELPSVDT
jgi:predicted DNA-binding transcriptional regulator AlpA